jgi:hypothetical protein
MLLLMHSCSISPAADPPNFFCCSPDMAKGRSAEQFRAVKILISSFLLNSSLRPQRLAVRKLLACRQLYSTLLKEEKTMRMFRASKWLICIISIFFVWACGGGSGGTSGSDSTGTLALSLVDAPGGSYGAVYVTIQEVQVCLRDGMCEAEDKAEACDCRWETVATVNQTYNLLELVNGVMAGLGQKDLEAGTYNQMRLLLGSNQDETLHPFPQYLIEDGQVREMKVSSGYQTGIKLVHPFEIVAGLTTELILDFDVADSVVKAGNSGNYLLKPTIKVIGTHNRAVVSGMVTDEDTDAPLAGAMVKAWHQNAEGDWIPAMGTVTAESGAYMLYLDLGGDYQLDPKSYKIVAAADGYEPACTALMAEVDQVYETNFTLAQTQMVTVEGTITGAVAENEEGSYPETGPIITVSFSRQAGECFMEEIETAFVLVTHEEGMDTEDFYYDNADGSFQYMYSIEVPAGVYDVTASADGMTTLKEVNFAIDGTDPLTLDFDF